MESSNTPLPTETKDIIPHPHNQLEEGNLSSILSEGTVINYNGVLKSPLYFAGEILNSKRFSTNDIKIGLITLVGLNSVHLGNPLAIEIIGEDESCASKLLKHCLDMTPESYVKQFQSISLDELYSAGNGLKNKAIVTFNSEGLKHDASQRLNDLFLHGTIEEQVKSKSRYGVGLQQVTIEGPIACVFLAKELKDSCLSVPSAIHLTLGSDQNILDSGFVSALGQNGSEDSSAMECARIKFIFERMQSQDVKIPYLPKIVNRLETNVQNAAGKAAMIKAMIANITRINNPPKLSMDEVVSRFFRLDKHEIAKWVQNKEAVPNQKLLESKEPENGNKEALTSTKFDYYIFKVLMDGILTKCDEKLSPRRWKVFTAIKDLCLIPFKPHMELEGDSEDTILNSIHSPGGDRYWPNKENIKSKIKSDWAEEIPESTLNMELNALIKGNYIESRKASTTKRNIYAVTTFDLDSIIDLPDPSEIIDPIYNGESIAVVNPITGDVENV
jgi:hypothetical protein